MGIGEGGAPFPRTEILVAVLDEEGAEYARTVPGTCDYYLFGEYRLQLQADTDGVLASITLAK